MVFCCGLRRGQWIYKRAGSEITEGRRLLHVNEDSGPDNDLPV